jgi:hypothetical protein
MRVMIRRASCRFFYKLANVGLAIQDALIQLKALLRDHAGDCGRIVDAIYRAEAEDHAKFVVTGIASAYLPPAMKINPLPAPTVNPKQLSIACESVDNPGDGRSPQVDLVRRGRAVPVARSLANRSSRPSASAQCAEA